MATAVLMSILKSTMHLGSTLRRVVVSVRTSESLKRLQHTLAEPADLVEFVLGDNVRVAKAANTVLLGLKPYMVDSILGVDGMAEALKGKVVINILAGVSTAQNTRKTVRTRGRKPTLCAIRGA